MGALRLKITGAVPIHGKNPGDEFAVPTDEDGVIIPQLWRKRVTDEASGSPPGIVAVIDKQIAPPATPPMAVKKGDK